MNDLLIVVCSSATFLFSALHLYRNYSKCFPVPAIISLVYCLIMSAGTFSLTLSLSSSVFQFNWLSVSDSPKYPQTQTLGLMSQTRLSEL